MRSFCSISCSFCQVVIFFVSILAVVKPVESSDSGGSTAVVDLALNSIGSQ